MRVLTEVCLISPENSYSREAVRWGLVISVRLSRTANWTYAIIMKMELPLC